MEATIMWNILDELRERAPERQKLLARSVRARVNGLRDRSEVRWWTFETRALSRMEDALAGAPELPVLGRLADAAENLVHRRRKVVEAPPIANYAALNAKDAARAIRDLRRRVDLLSIRQHEVAGKNRKTVIDAITQGLHSIEPAVA
jgi:hypothetical protein